MYQALYRKWRPRTFDDVAGQDHITLPYLADDALVTKALESVQG